MEVSRRTKARDEQYFLGAFWSWPLSQREEGGQCEPILDRVSVRRERATEKTQMENTWDMYPPTRLIFCVLF